MACKCFIVMGDYNIEINTAEAEVDKLADFAIYLT